MVNIYIFVLCTLLLLFLSSTTFDVRHRTLFVCLRMCTSLTTFIISISSMRLCRIQRCVCSVSFFFCFFFRLSHRTLFARQIILLDSTKERNDKVQKKTNKQTSNQCTITSFECDKIKRKKAWIFWKEDYKYQCGTEHL